VKLRLRRFDHRQAVGGMWGPIGEAQFDFLVGEGLEPEHHLLDVGCGSLRAGVHFVRYLELGHYCGMEKDPRILDGGRLELREAGLADKCAELVVDDKFRFGRFERQFDYALAQSVFTHLPFNPIVRCLREIEHVLAPGGRFYATFNQTDTPRLGMTDQDPFRYDPDIFRWAVEGSSLDFKLIGLWGHPRGTHPMMAFTKRG
jgi:SAM-dependent methyltransferase